VRRDLEIADRRNRSKTSKARFINPPHPSFSEGGSKTSKAQFINPPHPSFSEGGSKTSKARFINPPHPSFSEGGSKTEKHLLLPRGSWGTQGDLIIIYEQKILTNTNNNPNDYHRLSFCIFPLRRRGTQGDLIIVPSPSFPPLEKGDTGGFNNNL